MRSRSCASRARGVTRSAGRPRRGPSDPTSPTSAARSTIGARTVENTPPNLAKWIVDAPSMKPGALMPRLALSSRDVSNIVTYLEGLG